MVLYDIELRGVDMVKESQKQARNKWDAEHMTVVGCKVRRDIAEKFKAATAAENTTPNAVLRDAIDRFLEQHDMQNQPE